MSHPTLALFVSITVAVILIAGANFRPVQTHAQLTSNSIKGNQGPLGIEGPNDKRGEIGSIGLHSTHPTILASSKSSSSTTNAGSDSGIDIVLDAHSTVSSNTIKETNSIASGKGSDENNGRDNPYDGNANPTHNDKETPLLLPTPLPFP
jgi:hypothetical protein